MTVSSNELLDKILLYTPLIVSFILFVITLVIPLQNEKSRKWLSFMMLCIAVSFFSPFLHYILNAGILLYFDVFFIPFALASAVFHYFYVLTTVQDFKPSRKDLYHFLPIIIYGIVLFFLFSTLNDPQLLFYKANRTKHKMLLLMPEFQLIAIFHIVVFQMFFLAQLIFYTLKIYMLAIQQKKKIVNLSVAVETIDFKWIHKMNIVKAIITIIIIALFIVTYEKLEVRIFFNVLITITTVYFVLVCMFQEMTIGRQTIELQLNNNLQQELQIEDIEEAINNVIDTNFEQTNNQDNLDQRLTAYFEEAKPYLNPDLKIDDLCIVLKTNRNYLSKTINNKYGMNFSNFINSFRIGRAKELLSDKKFEHYSIQGVAEMSGFKSSSSFYTFFKQIVGVTPADFRKEIGKQV
ncbi:MAG: AraC family transcriptional regulator [Mariniphaga sp.]